MNNTIIICLIFAILMVIIAVAWHLPNHSSATTLAAAPRSAPLRGGPKLLVIRNFNPQSGLHWMLHCLILASHQARRYGLRLVVLFDSGLYLETRQQFLNEHIDPQNNEWFSYYFEPIGADDPYIQALWHNGQLDDLPSLTAYDPEMKKEPSFLGWTFDRAAFDKRPTKGVDFHREWMERMVMKPYLQQIVDAFYQQKMQGKYMIGIHYRGSDKYGDANCNEDDPKHFTYERCCEALEKAADEARATKGGIAIAVLLVSDEKPFIEYATNRLTSRGINAFDSGENVLRSNVNTSGLELQSQYCGGGTRNTHPDCAKYLELAAQSIHRGFSDYSNFAKGYDAVYEVALLAKCDVFFRSRGNFSNSPGYINPGMKIIDMVSQFK